MQLPCLGIDQIRGEHSRIAAEERVREGAGAPEEPCEVQADEQLGGSVEEALAEVRDDSMCEERPERKRVIQVSRDQNGAEVVTTLGDDTTASTTEMSAAPSVRSRRYSRQASSGGSSSSAYSAPS